MTAEIKLYKRPENQDGVKPSSEEIIVAQNQATMAEASKVDEIQVAAQQLGIEAVNSTTQNRPAAEVPSLTDKILAAINARLNKNKQETKTVVELTAEEVLEIKGFLEKIENKNLAKLNQTHLLKYLFAVLKKYSNLAIPFEHVETIKKLICGHEIRLQRDNHTITDVNFDIQSINDIKPRNIRLSVKNNDTSHKFDVYINPEAVYMKI